jgi:hypothetical protein
MSTLLENPGHTNHWMGLKLSGVKSNRSAIGARVKVVTDGQSFYRMVNSGSSFGDTPFEQHIGLGEAKTIRQVEIRWPSGLVQHFENLATNTVYQLKENDAKLTTLAVTAFRYRQTPAAMHHH